MPASPPALLLEDVRKYFGATEALKGVSVAVMPGTVHALVGENGAGKSTALGILAGRISATSGRVEVFGEQLKGGDPRASRAHGIVAIYQELTILPALTVEANVFLGQALSRAGFLANKQMRARYLALCERMGVRAIPSGTLAGTLSVADQQVLEILRALVTDARVVLFDEPTASLAIGERQALYRLIESLKKSGVTIVFVSHNLDEVLELSDSITVFRDGSLVRTDARENFSKATLVQAMVGKAGDKRIIQELLDEHEQAAAGGAQEERRMKRLAAGTGRPPLLQATGVTVPGAVENLELEVRAGELVGIGGLVGAGRTTLLRALAGLEPHASGRLFIDGKEVAWPRTVREALRHGVALVPEDRKRQGLIPAMSSADNVALSGFRRASRAGYVTERLIEKETSDVAVSFGFRQDRLRHKARELSGGNQQKLLLARWKFVTPKVLLADEPTKGIDVGAKAEILASLETMAENGLGLVMVSSELEEVAVTCDRVYVLAEGRLVGKLARSDGGITAADILNLAFQVHETV